MLRVLSFVLCLVAALPGAAAELALEVRPADATAVDAWIDANLGGLVERYETLHAHPELSLAESETARGVADRLAAAGFEVTREVGGHGVVAVLANGPGPVVLIRGDMDALPVEEQTGLPYASHVRAKREDGSETFVMHACGHDVHTTALVGTATLLADLRARWSGTVVAVAQSAEEVGKGAKMMIDDGLFERFPKPAYALALHVDSELPAGQLVAIEGWTAANVDSVDIRVHGRGGHGARPQTTVDPVVTAAYMITALQTIVSRRVNPIEPAVVTVGSIHGGFKHNVIPDEVALQLTVRSYSDEVRTLLLDSIRQIAEDTCKTFGCPKPPEVVVKDEYTPAAWNDPELARAAKRIFADYVGPENVVDKPPAMGGEDFGRLPRAAGARGLLFRLGSVDPATFAVAQRPGATPLPSLHSSRYAPDVEPTLRTGIGAMSRLALAILDER